MDSDRNLIVTGDSENVHPACVWGETLQDDDNAACEKHPEKPAVVILYYPTRHACADCVAEFEGRG